MGLWHRPTGAGNNWKTGCQMACKPGSVPAEGWRLFI